MFAQIRRNARQYWYKPPVSTVTNLSVEFLGPVIRGKAPVKAYDLNVNIDLKTILNGYRQ